MRVGAEIVLEIEGLADGPDAMGRIGEYVIFVAGALPGERVRIRVTSANRKYGRGEIVDIERRSPDRVGPACEHFLDCGGCHFQHLAYDAQLAHKTARLTKTLGYHLRGSQLPVLPMVGPEDPWAQRNKIALHVQGDRKGRIFTGLFRMRSREVVQIAECPVQDHFGTEVAFRAADAIEAIGLEPWSERDDQGVVRSIVVRSTKSTEQAQVTLVSRRTRVPRLEKLADRLQQAGATGFAVNLNERPGPQLMGRETTRVFGPPRIAEEIGGVRYLSSPGAFFQTSAWGAAFLVEAVRRLVDPPQGAFVVDLYSGGGLLSLALADRAQVFGVEENPNAVADAEASARENGFRDTRFVAGKAERVIHALVREGKRPFAVVLDPPREGCDPAVVRAVASMRPERIVYVSCDPHALGRDVAAFAETGYALTRVEPLDMFPHAFHIEAVAVLERPREKRPRQAAGGRGPEGRGGPPPRRKPKGRS